MNSPAGEHEHRTECRQQEPEPSHHRVFGAGRTAGSARHAHSSRSTSDTKAVCLRERDLLPHIDDWLGTIFDPENIDATCDALVEAIDTDASIAARAEAQAAIRECDRKLERYRVALDGGTDPKVVGQWIAEVTRERREAEAMLRAASADADAVRMTKAQIREAVEEIGGLVGLVGVTHPKLRTRSTRRSGSAPCTTRTRRWSRRLRI